MSIPKTTRVDCPQVGGGRGIWLLRGSFTAQADPNTTGHALHHFGTRGIALCPEAKRAAEGGSYFFAAPPSSRESDSDSGGAMGIPGSTFEAWTITDPPPSFRGSYGFNQYLFHGFSSLARQPVNIDVLSLREASSIPLLLDGGLPMSKPRDNDRPPIREGLTTRMGAFCLNRHHGSVNALFLDWSVRRVGLKELWTLKWYKEIEQARAAAHYFTLHTSNFTLPKRSGLIFLSSSLLILSPSHCPTVQAPMPFSPCEGF